MSSTLFIEIAVILILILANGFFSAAEIAIVSARRSRLQHEIDIRHAGAKQALDLAEHPERFLATVQVGITLISTFTAAFGGANISEPLAVLLRRISWLQSYADSIALACVVLLITYFTLILGELVPKRLALQFAERIAIATAPFMLTMAAVVQPAIAILNGSVNFVLFVLHIPRSSESPVTEEDIVYLARQGMASGTVERREEQFINRVFDFTDRPLSGILTPRTEIVAVEVGTPLPEVITAFLNSGNSRLPLYQDSLDNIVGILFAKDLLRIHVNDQKDIDLTTIARPAFFVSEYQHADDLLTTFRREGTHMAIVLDEYSQVIGLVTLEDMLEELVGEIQDEYDTPEDNAFIRRPDGTWLVDAMEAYDTVWHTIGLEELPQEEEENHDYHTLAGLILSHLGRIPNPGDTVTIGNTVLEVVDMDGRRIDKVLIRPKKEQEQET